MGASKVAQWKIDRIARTLAVQSFDGHLKELLESGRKIAYDFYRKQIPDDLWNLWLKYKETGVFNERGGWSFYYHSDKSGKLDYSWQYNLDLPDFTSTNLKDDKKVVEKMAVFGNQWKALSKEQEVFRKKLICTLETLKTPAKIRDNFPEAYELLLKLDADQKAEEEAMQNRQKDNLCDSVENLRAQLKHNNTQNGSEQDQNKG